MDIYNSFYDFTVFYVISTVIIILGIIFNNQLCALEDRFDEWLKAKIKQRKEQKK